MEKEEGRLVELVGPQPDPGVRRQGLDPVREGSVREGIAVRRQQHPVGARGVGRRLVGVVAHQSGVQTKVGGQIRQHGFQIEKTIRNVHRDDASVDHALGVHPHRLAR